jgi:DNA helicase-2/ATP-dependent DNA helicase PcrA
MSRRAALSLYPTYLVAAEDLRDNPGQWQVYESKGNCVVLAGPGSGKTKTLTIKLARMLSEDVRPPRGVACITYNTECAEELRRRLDALGIQESDNVYVGTVHAFCLKHIVLPFGRVGGLNLPPQVSVAAPGMQEQVFVDAFAQVFGNHRNPYGERPRMDKYRRTHIDRNTVAWRGDDAEMAQVIDTYEQMLRKRGLIDFDDMVLMGLHLIERHEWVRKTLRARFPILAVDEYQDLGVPLHRIVLSLAFSAGVRILAVGDEDQSIYGFTGARPELLVELSKMDGIETVRLPFNYRSGKAIVDASLVALGEKRGYTARSRHQSTIDVYHCPEGLKQQADLICTKLVPEALRRRNGRELSDVAVLYLDKNDGDVIEAAAKQAGLKVIRTDKGAPYRKTRLIRWLEDCAAWCASGWRTGQPRLSALIRTWLALNVSPASDDARAKLRRALVSFLFAHRQPDLPVRIWLAEFESACLKDTLQREKTLSEEGEALKQLAAAVHEGGKFDALTVAGFGHQGGAPDHLNLITLHSAKGREFDVVLMMGMDQGRIPSWSAKTAEQKREPRRLFYVGLTRARHEVYMTYSGFTTDSHGRKHNDGPSEFLREVVERLHEGSKQL